MREGIGSLIWKIAVALYLITNGILGLLKESNSDFIIIFKRMGLGGDALSIFVIIASVIAFIAGIAILLELFHIELPFLEMLLLIIAIIWAVYIIINIISWCMGGFKGVWDFLQRLAVHTIVFSSLLIASKRFD